MTTEQKATAIAPANSNDERLRQTSGFKKLLSRPDTAAIGGNILVFGLFILFAHDSGMFSLEGVMTWTTVSAYLGLLAVGACLLMIAGEFDLSIGSMLAFAGMLLAIPPIQMGWPIELALLFSLVCCLSLGWLNGYIVVKTRLPSFIVTLAFLFILRGLTMVFSLWATNTTIVSGLTPIAQQSWLVSFLFEGQAFKGLFQWLAEVGVIATRDDGTALVKGLPKVVVWWFVMTAVGIFILNKTRFGNWIFACGGDSNAASNMGVPVKRVKISLFVLMAFCGWLFAVLQVLESGSAAADRGLIKEFEAVIAAVIGGALLTGGYGSVLGAAFGALLFGVVQIGITYTDVPSDWFRVFLGVMLLAAVLFNNYVRKRAGKG